jgi:hypothetical protein
LRFLQNTKYAISNASRERLIVLAFGNTKCLAPRCVAEGKPR